MDKSRVADERPITFFDADYAINKNKYELGKFYDFIIGALSYVATEPESQGFKFEGQEAIDFRAKIGDEPKYDEAGNVKPVEFSTASLCAFLPVCNAPDEVKYISTVDKVSQVKSFDKDFWKYNIIYREFDGTDINIPTFVIKTDENKALEKASQIQGVAWITGYLAEC